MATPVVLTEGGVNELRIMRYILNNLESREEQVQVAAGCFIKYPEILNPAETLQILRELFVDYPAVTSQGFREFLRGTLYGRLPRTEYINMHYSREVVGALDSRILILAELLKAWSWTDEAQGEPDAEESFRFVCETYSDIKDRQFQEGVEGLLRDHLRPLTHDHMYGLVRSIRPDYVPEGMVRVVTHRIVNILNRDELIALLSKYGSRRHASSRLFR